MTLLGEIARGAESDVNVLALGEWRSGVAAGHEDGAEVVGRVATAVVVGAAVTGPALPWADAAPVTPNAALTINAIRNTDVIFACFFITSSFGNPTDPLLILKIVIIKLYPTSLYTRRFKYQWVSSNILTHFQLVDEPLIKPQKQQNPIYFNGFLFYQY